MVTLRSVGLREQRIPTAASRVSRTPARRRLATITIDSNAAQTPRASYLFRTMTTTSECPECRYQSSFAHAGSLALTFAVG
jgi:hypothetical protein